MDCPKCGITLEVGMWPWCDHPRDVKPMIIDDQLEGGPRFFDTLGHEDVWIESKSQRQREMDKRGLIDCNRRESWYYAAHRKQHMERLRDEKAIK